MNEIKKKTAIVVDNGYITGHSHGCAAIIGLT